MYIKISLYIYYFRQQYFFNSLFYGFEMQISKFIEFHFLSLLKLDSQIIYDS